MNESNRLSLSSTVVAASDVLASEIGAEHVLLNLRDGMYYGLEAVSSEIWRLLQHPIEVSEICRTIVHTYDVEPERCHQDVVRLLDELVERRLVDVHTRQS